MTKAELAKHLLSFTETSSTGGLWDGNVGAVPELVRLHALSAINGALQELRRANLQWFSARKQFTLPAPTETYFRATTAEWRGVPTVAPFSNGCTARFGAAPDLQIFAVDGATSESTSEETGTDLVTDDTFDTVVSTVSHTFDAGDVGRRLDITGGTGFTVASFIILSVSGGKATLNGSAGATGLTAGEWSLFSRPVPYALTGTPMGISREIITPYNPVTFFGDSWAVPSDYSLVSGGVRINGNLATEATTRHQFEAIRISNDFGERDMIVRRGQSGPVTTVWQQVHMVPTDGGDYRPEIWLRFAPMPTGNTAVDVDLVVKDTWTLSDLASTSAIVGIPGDEVEMLLRPIAIQRFKSSPYFRNNLVNEELARQLRLATERLERMSPRQDASPCLVVVGV